MGRLKDQLCYLFWRDLDERVSDLSHLWPIRPDLGPAEPGIPVNDHFGWQIEFCVAQG